MGMVIAIIPARGGSKRIPRKNIKNFCGQPMISWTINAAIESGCFDHVIVSTDDEEIAIIAKEYGAIIPFMRPSNLSDDHTATVPVVNHAIEQVTSLIGSVDHVCCIYPTAPFLSAKILSESYEKLISTASDFVFPVTSYPFPIEWALKRKENGEAEMLYPEHRQTRSQDLEETYCDAGQFYWGTRESFLDGKDVFKSKNNAWILPRHLVHDIDTEEDWEQAEIAFRVINGV